MRLSQKRARQAGVAYIIGSSILLVVLGCTRLSMPWLDPGYTLALVAFALVLLFWVAVLYLSGQGIGLRAYVQKLHSPDVKPSESLSESEYLSKLVEKLSAMRSTCATFAGITIAVLGIIVVVGVSLGSFALQLVVYSVVSFLIVAAILLIHAVDACDTAANPRIPIAMLERIRRTAMNYYAVGLFCLIASVLLGVSIVNPYLTAVSSIVYMAIVCHYFFIWE